MPAPKFQFRLERVRALRERAEDQAKEELAGAMTERARWAGRLSAASERLEGARVSKVLAAHGGIDAGMMLAHQAFLESAERAEQSAELDLHRQETEVQARRTALQEAARERHVLEKLKQKKAAEHRLVAERIEGAELDELALSRHRRGPGAGA